MEVRESHVLVVLSRPKFDLKNVKEREGFVVKQQENDQHSALWPNRRTMLKGAASAAALGAPGALGTRCALAQRTYPPLPPRPVRRRRQRLSSSCAGDRKSTRLTSSHA